jgi:hypothetical protein
MRSSLYFLFVVVIIMLSCGKTCPEGYRGRNCDIEITPSKVSISKITVTNFATNDPNLSQWDVGSSADIYPVVTGEDINNVVWTCNTYFDNATPGIHYEFVPPAEVELIYPSMYYRIGIYDYDGGTFFNEDDLVGSVSFKPYQIGLGFPEVLTFSSGSTSVNLYVKYFWD